MSLKHRRDSITEIRLREALQTKVAVSSSMVDGFIVLELTEGATVCTGTLVKFKAPCDCNLATGGVIINGKSYSVVDASGDVITGIGGFWNYGAALAVIIDDEAGKAFLQNAATGGLTERISKHEKNKSNPHEVGAVQVNTSEECAEQLGIQHNPTVDEGLKIVKAGLDAINDRLSGANDAGFRWLAFKNKAVGVAFETLTKDRENIDAGVDLIVSRSIEIACDGTISLVDPFTLTVYDTSDLSEGLYIQHEATHSWDVPSGIFMVLSETEYEPKTSSNTSGNMNSYGEIALVARLKAVLSYDATVTDENPTAFPDDGWSGDTYYLHTDGGVTIPSIFRTSYTGTGSSGVNAPNTLAFPFVPAVVFIQTDYWEMPSTYPNMTYNPYSAMMINGVNIIADGITALWDDDAMTVSWYHESNSSRQWNVSGRKYFVTAFGTGGR